MSVRSRILGGLMLAALMVVPVPVAAEGPGTWSYAWKQDRGYPAAEFLERPDLVWTPTEKIWNPPGRVPDGELWLRFEPGAPLPESPAFFIEGFDQIAEVYAERDRLVPIYAFGSLDRMHAVIFQGYPFHIIPFQPGDSTLYFRIFSDHVNIGIIGEPLIGREGQLLGRVVRGDIDRLVLGAWVLLGGLFALLLFVRNRKQTLFLSFALVCFLSALYVLTRTQVKQLLIDAPLDWTLLELAAVFLIPAAFYFHFDSMLGRGRWNHRRILIGVQLVFAPLALAVGYFRLVPLMDTLAPGQALMALCILLVSGATFIGAYGGDADAKIVALGLGLAALTGIHDLAAALGLLGWNRFITHYGLLFFLVSLGVVLVRRVEKTSDMLEKTGKYLSRVIRDQDATVAFRTEVLQRSRDEIEKISEVAKQINASTDLDTVLDQIFWYFYTEFGVEAVILQLVDQERNELYTIKTTAPPNAEREMIEFSRNLTIPLDESSGIIYKTYKRNRPFYLAKIDDRAFPHGAEREIIDALKLKSFALMPLSIGTEVVAMILLTSYDRKLALSREELRRIDRFAEQIAGAINHANLLRRAENARREAQKERRKAEDIRDEIEALNKFAREVSSNPNLDAILDMIFYYVISQFNLMGCYLYLRDEKEDELYHYKSMLPDTLDPEKVAAVRGRRISLDSDSILAAVCRRKRALYLPRFRRRGGTAEDHSGLEMFGVSSMYMVPLLVQDRVRGLIAFSNFESPMYLRPQDQASIERFCLQISGAIFTASLLRQIDEERKTADRLLLNVLPADIAQELKDRGAVEPREYEAATVLFTDIKNFTAVVKNLDPHELLLELDKIFEQFDWICDKNKMEKLKTIGDAYMCVGGLPNPNRTHPIDACLTAMEIQAFMNQTREIKREISGEDFWELRIGLHTGAMVAGVVGKNKFSYDIWGDAVNVAARMETGGEAGKVNISQATYEQVKYFFQCEHRGQFAAKNRGMLDMYFLVGIRPELSRNGEGRVPNDKFRELYDKVAAGARLRFRSEESSNG